MYSLWKSKKTHVDAGPQPCTRSNTIMLPQEQYTTPMAVLNACIRELSSQRSDIQKIEIFEEPPQAIINIQHQGSSTAPAKSFWRAGLKRAKPIERPALRLKLDVEHALGGSAPYQVNYEITQRAG